MMLTAVSRQVGPPGFHSSEHRLKGGTYCGVAGDTSCADDADRWMTVGNVPTTAVQRRISGSSPADRAARDDYLWCEAEISAHAASG
jgi:hypothetical protein